MRRSYGTPNDPMREHIGDSRWSDVARDPDHRVLASHELRCHPLSASTRALASPDGQNGSFLAPARARRFRDHLGRLWRSTFGPVNGMGARYGVFGFHGYVVPNQSVEITDDSGYEVGGY